MGKFGQFSIPGDYDGNGVTQRAFCRPSENRWFIDGEPDFVWGWDTSNFMPITSRINIYNWFRFCRGCSSKSRINNGVGRSNKTCLDKKDRLNFLFERAKNIYGAMLSAPRAMRITGWFPHSGRFVVCDFDGDRIRYANKILLYFTINYTI